MHKEDCWRCRLEAWWQQCAEDLVLKAMKRDPYLGRRYARPGKKKHGHG